MLPLESEQSNKANNDGRAHICQRPTRLHYCRHLPFVRSCDYKNLFHPIKRKKRIGQSVKWIYGSSSIRRGHGVDEARAFPKPCEGMDGYLGRQTAGRLM